MVQLSIVRPQNNKISTIQIMFVQIEKKKSIIDFHSHSNSQKLNLRELDICQVQR